MSIPRIVLACLAFSAWCRAEFPAPYDTEKASSIPRMSAEEAAAKFQVPPGFEVSVFAAEPDVQNPIAMAWDGRGRLWVAENYTYAERPKRFDLALRDRVIIFEDKDGDGRAETRKVFTDDVQMLTSVEVGRGGVWLMCPPQVLFIPDRDGDDVPDGPAEVVLDGFTVAQDNYHNFANGLRWGPDGWLYGRCGHSCPGMLGIPGTPDAQRVPIRGGVWRFHPTRKVVEVLTHGTTNPWGHDWDRHGAGFFINTVTGHLWHLIPGAHLVDSNPSINPHVYERMDTIADHWHFDRNGGRKALADSTADALGGGHAHIGMMIYQGDNWPAEYRGRLFTWNMHGRRANQEIIERVKTADGRLESGYVGRHGKDVFLAADPWFRGIDLSYGPDGGVFALDWNDIGECHESNGVHRTSGRIFKITYGEPKRVGAFDLAKISDAELVKLHTHENEWWVRQARVADSRIEKPDADCSAMLKRVFENDSDPAHKLRALWTHYSKYGADDRYLAAQLNHPNEHVRAWAVRLLTDKWPLDTCMSKRPAGIADAPDPWVLIQLESLATSEASGLVRLALASVLQRVPADQRGALASALAAHSEDANDPALPLMIWYGLIPVADSYPMALVALAKDCALPLTRRFIARRLVEDVEKNPAPVNALLISAATKDPAFKSDILTGMAAGMTGWRKAKKPEAWDGFVAALRKAGDLDGEGTAATIAARVRELSVLFGDGRALDEVKRIALDGRAELGARKAALQTLIESNPPDLRDVCESLLGTRFLNAVAARGLSRFDDAALGEKLAKSYRSFHGTERGRLIETLVSRSVFAKALLAEMASGKIPRSDMTPFHARQIRAFNDPSLTKLLVEAWGELREPAADKQALIAKLKSRLSPDVLAKADLSAGRAAFTTFCGTCHRLYGQGNDIGPDLTGSGRDNLDYLLENIADPGAVVNADFRVTIAEMKDGRVLAGVVAAQTARTVTIRALTGSTTVERDEIRKLEQSTASMMPEGLLETMSETQARDLIGYLMQKTQVPLPGEKK